MIHRSRPVPEDLPQHSQARARRCRPAPDQPRLKPADERGMMAESPPGIHSWLGGTVERSLAVLQIPAHRLPTALGEGMPPATRT